MIGQTCNSCFTVGVRDVLLTRFRFRDPYLPYLTHPSVQSDTAACFMYSLLNSSLLVLDRG